MSDSDYEVVVIPGLVRMHGPILWTCKRCGCAVHDKVRHDMWHDQGGIQ